MSDVTGHGWRAEDSGEFSAGFPSMDLECAGVIIGGIDKQSHIIGIG